MSADPARLEAQLRFLVELDRLKQVLRRTRLVDGSRRENSAEHSWHLGVSAVLLAEYAPPGTDLARVLAMVLVHDVIEIDAGDTFCYDLDANLDREARERRAADRLFGMLPPEQGAELRALWEEFEAGRSPEARFAVALDRLQPLLQNFHGGGGTWREHGVAHDRVVARMRPIHAGAPPLWPAVVALLDEALARGYIEPAVDRESGRDAHGIARPP
ncbi:MAG TPA: HD domain-containing protein [Longimicrobium sp.]|nr:HD domain-containing protein [Longimicrobium sp.]